MIIYDLCCDKEHRFEGWFQSPADFESQLKQLLITCPKCDSDQIRRIPSAVAISNSRSAFANDAPALGEVMAAMPAGAETTSLYHQLATLILANSENVGTAFAEEARRIHHRDAQERPICEQTTDEEYKSLQDEGIDVIRLPMLKKEDLS